VPTVKYIPLGGLGEVGLNMWALEWEGKILVVDVGLMFPQEDMFGVDIVIPDMAYLREPGHEVIGVFLTHGHEDHIGALAFLLRQLRVPVYGTRLTLGLVRPRLREYKVHREADLREVRAGDRVQLGPYQVETIPVCHSIPDAVGLAIRTPVGTVLYTGDFKLDSAPLDGNPTDLGRFAQLGRDGILLMLSDSTNAERGGFSGSERELVEPFRRVFQEATGRIVVATFASNIYRIQHVVRLAQAFGRRIGVVGRSLQSNFKTAQQLGFLDVPADLALRLEAAEKLADDKVVLLTAGSQGEPVSALARFAAKRHPLVNVREGDTVVISATPIPGNERLVHRTVNNLYRNGARVFYAQTGRVHVSGHAYQEELKLLLSLVRPRFFIPVHGEYRQLLHHANLARETLPDTDVLIVEDGQTVELSPDRMDLGERVSAGLVYVDGLGIGDVEQVVLRDRRLLAQDGILLVTVTVDRDGGRVRAGPDLMSRGFIDPGLSAQLMAEARNEVLRVITLAGANPGQGIVLKDAIHEAMLTFVHRRTKRRPMVIPIVTEL
jgi:ribonuclease J